MPKLISGWKRSLPDHRDLLLEDRITIPPAEALPASVDLQPKSPPIYQQNQLGSCTANGWARVMEMRAMAQGKVPVTPSRLFIYFQERSIEGTLGQDSGAQVRTGAQVVSSTGVPPETVWPYDIAKYNVAPPAEAYIEAKQELALEYNLVTVDPAQVNIRAALAQGLPVVFGFSVPSYFENNIGWSFNQPLPLPGPQTQIVGGHCVTLAGYDDGQKFGTLVYKVANSWGPDWGNEGYFWMPSTYFAGPNPLASDLWVVREVSPTSY